jgi:hypothetical protein
MLPIVTVVMSAPLFLSFQLRRPPDSLYGVPYILLWTWSVLATGTVPLLIAAETVFCLWIVLRNTNRLQTSLGWHVLALIVATVAYAVFRLARSPRNFSRSGRSGSRIAPSSAAGLRCMYRCVVVRF